MKKIFIVWGFFIIAILTILVALLFWPKKNSFAETFYLNAYDDISYADLERLATSIKKEGIPVKLSAKNDFHSGLINIYATKGFSDLPPILDKNAINFLWLPYVEENEMEKLRPFDVIVVKSIPSFSHLKAINVRTAYIPDAIDISSKKLSSINQSYPMYFGDNDLGFSLALYLAGPTDLKIDVYGKGFSGYWSDSELMNRPAKPSDFQRYPLVLADQSDDDIRHEIINRRIITIIENGGLPYVRYNNGIVKMFGDTIPMYQNETEFLPKIKQLLNNQQNITEYRNLLFEASKLWNSEKQAKKFIELADIMKKKMKSLK